MHQKLLQLEAILLNEASTVVDPEALHSVVECGVDEEYAYALLVASAFGMKPDDNEGDALFFKNYLLPNIHHQSVALYTANPYYSTIRMPDVQLGETRFSTESYAPYEAFPCGDLQQQSDGRLLAPLGFFSEPFYYPAIFQNDCIWMSVTPNEILTIQPAIDASHGNVLAFGLGLGYFPFMATLKPEVRKVTVVDKSPQIIALFQKHILPQFPHPEKIELICADAFEYAETSGFAVDHSNAADIVFTDLWHDASDGIPLYQRMKSLEPLSRPGTQFYYWIEPSMRYYIEK